MEINDIVENSGDLFEETTKIKSKNTIKVTKEDFSM